MKRIHVVLVFLGLAAIPALAAASTPTMSSSCCGTGKSCCPGLCCWMH